jgi:hypothetical protein
VIIKTKELEMYVDNQINYGFEHEGIRIEVLDNGAEFSVEITDQKDVYSVTIGNTTSDQPSQLVSYLKAGLSFLMNDIEEGRYQGSLEDHENVLWEIIEGLEGWEIETHEHDGTYYKRTIEYHDESPIVIYLRTEEEEEWATDYSPLVFQASRVITLPIPFRVVLPSAMMKALAFAYEHCAKVNV